MRVLKKMLLFCGIGALCLAGALVGAARVSPSVTEKALMLGLISGHPWIQKSCAEKLRDYPTKTTVLTLVAFVNLKHPRPTERFLEFKKEAEEKKKKASPDSFQLSRDEYSALEERAKREATLQEPLASEALISLGFLTGHSFGSYFKEEKYGYSWGTLSESDWKKVLGEMNAWALKTFGGRLSP